MCIGSNIHNVNVDQPCDLDSTSITYLEAQLAKPNFGIVILTSSLFLELWKLY